MLTTKKVISNSWWIGAAISLVLIVVVIPVVIVLSPQDFELEIPPGKQVKTGSRIFYKFLEQVSVNNDVIVLGTSETGKRMGGNNYWCLLDQDSALTQRFHCFGGAGRCSYVFFPLVLDNPEVFKGLNVVIYINPTYWRRGLNLFRKDYYERYIDPMLINEVRSEAKEIDVYEKFMRPAAPLPFLISGDRLVNNFRSFYYHDLRRFLFDETAMKPFEKKGFVDSTGLKSLEKSLGDKINLSLNVTHEFEKTNSDFPEIDTTSNFQNDMLKAFITMVDTYQINCLFYIGPINEMYGAVKNPELLKEHYDVIEGIKEILNDRNQPFLDGTAQGKIPGTFTDIQHISEYGAYLTAMQIKEYYEKEN